MKIVNYTGSDLKDLAAIKNDIVAAVFANKQRESAMLNAVRTVESITFETVGFKDLKLSSLYEEARSYRLLAELNQYQLGRLNEFIGMLKSQARSVDCGVTLKGFVVENIVITYDGVFAVDTDGLKECGKLPKPCDGDCTCDEYSELAALDV